MSSPTFAQESLVQKPEEVRKAEVAPKPDVLRTVEQIHQLLPEDLHKGMPVDLECIVTCYEPDWAILFINDGSNINLYLASKVHVQCMLG